MRRGTTAAVLVLAAVVGIMLGTLAFVQVGALAIRPGADPSRSPDPTTPSTPSSPSTGSSPTGSGSPSASPSGSPSAPPFTERALLQPDELEDHGWGSATVVDTWDGYPDDQISSCTTLRASDGDPVAAHAALYRGDTTTAVEIVVRFESEQAAESAMASLRERIEACRKEPDGDPDLGAEAIEASTPDSLDAREMWDTTGVSERAEGFIGLARARDRIAFLTMISLTTDPLVTTRCKSLTSLAGQRLV